MKVVIIGNEGHTMTAIKSLRNNSDLKLCGISTANPIDIRPELNQQLQAEYGCDFFDDYREMLDKVKPDVACIGTRLDQNGPVSVECLKRGVNCYTEKTIAHSFEVLDEIKKAATATNTKIIGMHTMRYDPHFYAAHEAVASGAIGKPMMVIGRKSYKFGDFRPEYYKTRKFYGSTLLWVAVHAIDWAYWIGGDMTNIVAMHTNENNFGYGDCEASSVLSFTYANGGLGTITADFYQPQKAEFHGDDQLRVAGEKGVVEVLKGKAYITTHEKEIQELPLETPRDFFYDYCLELQGKAKCRLSMEDTFKVTEVALKAREYADKVAN